MCYLRPFFLRHQAKVDLVVGSAYGEMVKSFDHLLPVCRGTVIVLDIGGTIHY